MTSLTLSEVSTSADQKAFLELPYRAYGHMPEWRAPLRMERKNLLSPKHNPLLAQMEHCLFLARKGHEVVGRISAHINPLHLNQYNDSTGHFGFFDTLEPDPEVAHALLEAAESWLRARDLKRIAGPYSFSVNDECGLLVDGFDTPPMIMMPHGRPDYATAMSENGYTGAMDTFAFRYEFDETYVVPPRVARLLKGFENNPALSVRKMDMKHFKSDVALVMDIFNDAWSDNWGFIPFNDAQIKSMASELRPLIKADSLWIAYVDGEPAAFTLFLPDLNELTQGLNGNLLPFGWAKFLYRLKVRGETRARLPLAGLRKKFHKTSKGLFATMACFEAAFRAQHQKGVRQIEASWILETNEDMINICNLCDMDRYKTYRLYEKAL